MNSMHSTSMSGKAAAIQLRTQYGPEARIVPLPQNTLTAPQDAGGLPMQQVARGILHAGMIHPYQSTGRARPISRGFVGGAQHSGMQSPSVQSHGPSGVLNPATILIPPMSNIQQPTHPIQHANLAIMIVTPLQSFQQPISSIQAPTQQFRQSQQYQQSQPFQQSQPSIGRVTSSLSQGSLGRNSQINVPGPHGQRRSGPGNASVDERGGRTDPLAESDDDGLYYGRSGRVRHSSGHKKKGHKDRGPSWLRLFAT